MASSIGSVATFFAGFERRRIRSAGFAPAARDGAAVVGSPAGSARVSSDTMHLDEQVLPLIGARLATGRYCRGGAVFDNHCWARKYVPGHESRTIVNRRTIAPSIEM